MRNFNFFFNIILAFAIFIVVYPIFDTVITISDDSYYAADALAKKWPIGFVASTYTGRFYQIITHNLSYIAFMADGFWLSRVILIFFNVVIFINFYFLLKRILKDFTLSFFIVLINILLLEITRPHNPFHSFPLWFSFSMFLILLSVYFYQRFLEEDNKKYFYFSFSLYSIFILFYEILIFYGIIYFILTVIFLNSKIKIWKKLIFSSFKKILPFLISTLVYFSIYMSYRFIYPSEYKGNQLTFGNPMEIIESIIGFSIRGLNPWPLFFFHWPDFTDFRTISGFIIALITCIYFFKNYENSFKLKKLILLTFFSFGFMILPNLIFGFIQTYRDNWLYYIGSYYASFPMAMFLVFLLLIFLYFDYKFWLKRCLKIIVTVLICFSVAANMTWSTRFYEIHSVNKRQWLLLDQIGQKKLIKSWLKNSPLIFAPSLKEMPKVGMLNKIYFYWPSFFSNRLGFKVNIIYDELVGRTVFYEKNSQNFVYLRINNKLPELCVVGVLNNFPKKSFQFGLVNKVAIFVNDENFLILEGKFFSKPGKLNIFHQKNKMINQKIKYDKKYFRIPLKNTSYFLLETKNNSLIDIDSLKLKKK